jgi:hypothetical protein
LSGIDEKAESLRLFYFLLFIESFALYVVSAREELFAFPGSADGGSIPLLAAESGELLAEESCLTGALELF